MKLYAWERLCGETFFTMGPSTTRNARLIGTIEVNPIKKMVEGWAHMCSPSCQDCELGVGWLHVKFGVPVNAKNIKCTYEVEE